MSPPTGQLPTLFAETPLSILLGRLVEIEASMRAWTLFWVMADGFTKVSSVLILFSQIVSKPYKFNTLDRVKFTNRHIIIGI